MPSPISRNTRGTTILQRQIGAAAAAALPGIFLRSLLTAVKPPRGSGVFMPLHTALLLMRDALTLDDALKHLLAYTREHRAALAVTPPSSTLAVVSGHVLPVPPPPWQLASVAEPGKMWCGVYDGHGHAAGNCPSDPRVTESACLFCGVITHYGSECRSRPQGWQPGQLRWQRRKTGPLREQRGLGRDSGAGPAAIPPCRPLRWVRGASSSTVPRSRTPCAPPSRCSPLVGR